MVRFLSLSLLALAAGSAFAAPQGGQEVILDDPAHTLEGWSYENCGLPEDVIQLESISVTPDPPQPGKELTVTAVGTATDVIEDGAYADVVVKLGLVKLLSRTFDVCQEARTANTSIQCPVQKGKYTVVQSVVLPREIPRAKFTVNVRGYTANDDPMLCLDLKVDFMKPPFYRFW
ncbi:ML domain-containing protein [Scleroderma yunnanense]